MTALVSPERTTAASLTGAVGLLILAIAVVMMVIAAPTHGAHNPAKPSAAQLTTDLCHQLTSRSNSTTVYVCLAGPWAKEHASAL
jgi:glycerol uptake facilitator-like aquaporin